MPFLFLLLLVNQTWTCYEKLCLFFPVFLLSEQAVEHCGLFLHPGKESKAL